MGGNLDSTNWICVYKAQSPVNAEIVTAVLTDNGIESFRSDRRDSVYTFMGEIEVLVPEAQVKNALLVIESIEIN
ncbi:MAG: DUF2007 domain-containing protein [Bacteroidota bacterium]